jgi:DNA-binding HxlR family transcriptional regulator
MVAGPAPETAPAPPRAAGPASDDGAAVSQSREACCGLYHRAVELVGRRWTGAILSVLMDGPLRFSEIRALVPDLSDRLLSERLKELELEGIVERRVIESSPVRAEYTLTDKGRALEPAVHALKSWAHAWLT